MPDALPCIAVSLALAAAVLVRAWLAWRWWRRPRVLPRGVVWRLRRG